MSFEEMIVAMSATAGAIAVGGFSMSQHFRQERRKRELEHIERMKALQMGLRLPQDEPWLSPVRIGAALAIAVPIALFLYACVATQVAGYQENFWIAVCVVSVASVISGSALVASSIRKDATSGAAIDKPHIEEDAFDVVASRG